MDNPLDHVGEGLPPEPESEGQEDILPSFDDALPPEPEGGKKQEEPEPEGDPQLALEEDEDVPITPEQAEALRSVITPYPTTPPPATDRKQVKDHFYQQYLQHAAQQQGITDLKVAFDWAWKNDPAGMVKFEKLADEYAAEQTSKYFQEVVAPYQKQANDARICDEFTQVIQMLPDFHAYFPRIQEIGPAFFEKFPQLVDSPLKSLPLLYNLARHGGKSQRKNNGMRVQRGGSATKAPSQPRVGNQNFSPGDWVATL